ncbi:ferric-dicitrate binding protein FerR (iron transport regulator) [Mucilaginibacter sp. SG538B]|uniref:FecR family protein n=1 Tax=Mucilaginibacter sp. SG538B TaxID=2587021 RepID=UPI00159E3FC4|nr:FecR domain-containing protein [Mucilaginibacter sp. SG538B]NVM66753.1 ferric-dicitrate binding protein FerR (iron transport regulator) [Mucilaginibacter sp. SG538B]
MSDEKLISYIIGEASTREIAEVEAWQSIRVENGHRLEQFRTIWMASKKLDLKHPMNANESLARFKQKMPAEAAAQSKVFPINRPGKWLKAAAILLLALGTSWLFLQQRYNRQLMLSTAKMEVETDTLSDGSVITLNQNTSLKYPFRFKSHQREVWLEQGEAFFNVNHRANQPFIINAGKTRIQVLGTSFNVRNKKGAVEVLVENGLVSVTNGVHQFFLRQGEKLDMDPKSGILRLSKVTSHLYQYYRTREFVADDTPLPQLVNILNEAYGCRIIIENRRLDSLKLNSTFKNESLDDILDIISRTFKIRVIKNNETILLK